MNKLWVKKNSDVHGSGLFASQNIKKGSKIIEYVGDREIVSITKRDTRNYLNEKLLQRTSQETLS